MKFFALVVVAQFFFECEFFSMACQFILDWTKFQSVMPNQLSDHMFQFN